MKIIALATVAMLILTLNTTIPTQAYVPQETLYFHPNAGEYPGGNPGTLSTERPIMPLQLLSSSKKYWWESDKTYKFEDADDGIWVFHFYGNITPPQASCNVAGEIMVGHGETYYLVGGYDIKKTKRQI